MKTQNFFNKNIFTISLFVFLIFFSPLFFYSFKYIINIWAFSDAFINYSHGFVRRGLLGELILQLNKTFGVEVFYIHSFIFLIFTVINLILFLKLLYKVSDDRLIYFFLLFNPALILFPLYDTGGYLRKETFVICLMLIHTIVCSKYHRGDLSIDRYNKFLLILVPLVSILTLNHEIQFFLIPFHFCLTLNVYFEKISIKEIKSVSGTSLLYLNLYLITFIPFFYFIFNPTEINQLRDIYENVLKYDQNILWDPIKFVSKPLSPTIITETKDMFGSLNALKTYSVSIILALLPIFYIFFKYKNNNSILIKNHFLIILLNLPIILMFFIGRDWGRWINLMTFAVILYYLQFDIKKKYKLVFFKKNDSYLRIIISVSLIMLLIYYILFMMIPHCCNNTNYHMGGLIENFKMAFEVFFGDFNLHLDNTFRKN